ncbi:MAG: valine--tRNA ligase [Chitinophagaceae bacterium]|nr:valine--tRNA ligase [Oligoflexus sp.]
MIELESTYEHKKYEKKWYDYAVDQKLFHAPVDPKRKPFTILMPPPNVTSQLHMGHGLGYSIQDLLSRWQRMKGLNVCWLPGTDHAGIATQMMVEKDLEKEGLTRRGLGREKFFERLTLWKDKFGGMILDQFKTLGFSCDWERLAYTMDPKLSEAVRYVFVEMYNEGLIYRGERLVNWDTVLQTAISDDEVESKEVQGILYFYRYPIDGSDEQIPIATTRPETMLGDTAVAVNAEDERFKHLIGKNVRLPFTDRLIPIIADDYVKSEFGTGAVKITPAHDPNDFEIGKRHNLSFINVMTTTGLMADNTPAPFKGLDRFVARKEVIKQMKALGLFDEEKSYKTTIPHSERSKTVIEPRLSQQWFVKMQELAKPAADAARNDELHFHPDNWKKTYLYWLDNIQDWCISRQLWWGHRIPIWYCSACDGVTTGTTDPTHCKKCGGTDIHQDEDVLDTWFSSALWPLSPFGWPGKDKEDVETLEYFNPTDVLVTAPEIIFLWVARMVMMNLKFKKRLPFKDVYFNATVCDKQGRKFSKTLGNGIDPLDVIEKHGADAVRFTAISLAPLGGRVKMDVDDFDNGARFVNKIWNAARMVFQHLEPDQKLPKLETLSLNLSEKWLIQRLRETAVKVETHLQGYRVNDAVEEVYHFIWGAFCDWGLECAKIDLSQTAQAADKLRALSVLVYVFDGALRLAHPIMPFVTEELWQKMPAHPNWGPRPKSIAIAAFPTAEMIPDFAEDAAKWKAIQDIISGIRSVRSQMGLSPKQELPAHIRVDASLAATVAAARDSIQRLARADKVISGPDVERPGQSLTAVGPGFEIYLPVEGLIDIEKEKVRLTTEEQRLKKILMGIASKLDNKSFVDRAPEDILEQTRAQRANMEDQLAAIGRNLKALEA